MGNSRPVLWKDFYGMLRCDRAYFCRVINVEASAMRRYESRWYPDGAKRIFDAEKPRDVDNYIREAVRVAREEKARFAPDKARNIGQAQRLFDQHRRMFRDLWS